MNGAVFAYLRVSKSELNVENQRMEIESSGIKVDYWFSEVVSGSVSTSLRTEFQRLLGQIRDGETIVVSRLDRLGRDAIDVMSTVKLLEERNIKVIVLQLGNVDLTSSAGKMMMVMLSCVAEMERTILIERVQSGLKRAVAEGVKLGRRSSTTEGQRREIVQKLQDGVSVSQIAREYNVSRGTVINIRNASSH